MAREDSPRIPQSSRSVAFAREDSGFRSVALRFERSNHVRHRVRPLAGLAFGRVLVEALRRVGEVDVVAARELAQVRVPDCFDAAAAMARRGEVVDRDQRRERALGGFRATSITWHIH